MSQQMFNPIDYTFEWTEDWYVWDYTQAHRLARQARDNQARALRKAGHGARSFTLEDQLMSKGGIGSGHPHIQLYVNVYGLNSGGGY